MFQDVQDYVWHVYDIGSWTGKSALPQNFSFPVLMVWIELQRCGQLYAKQKIIKVVLVNR